jgi:hypothetical protein
MNIFVEACFDFRERELILVRVDGPKFIKRIINIIFIGDR